MIRHGLLKTRFLPNRLFCSAMEVNIVGSTEKRSPDRTEDNEGQESKKLKTDETIREVPKQGEPRADRKRKCALLISYNGKGYYGLQINPGFRTIESDLCKALLECDLIPQEHHDCMQKMSFQRAARTDKGVSAAGNVISLKMRLNEENLVDKINEKLPPQVRVMDYVRTTNAFNSKNFCDARTYIYVIPTFAFAPLEELATLDYRVDMATVERVNEVLEKYIGTHNFHNFTSGVKATDKSANRYILEFECRQPFVRDGMEFCVLSVKGQSFMLHQIRKMIGLMIAVVRGFCDISVIEQAWGQEKVDIPIAPGLGLVLEKLHYKRYNERFGSDGLHSKIEWSHIREKLDKFKEEQIFAEIIREEIVEKSMLNWLPTLFKHGFAEEIMWQKRKQLREVLANAEPGTKPGTSLTNQTAEHSISVGLSTSADNSANQVLSCVSANQNEGSESELTNQNIASKVEAELHENTAMGPSEKIIGTDICQSTIKASVENDVTREITLLDEKKTEETEKVTESIANDAVK